ncbi:MAG: TonB-dependent receptor domain-containing protein, partial [Ignavibacteria bacterium]
YGVRKIYLKVLSHIKTGKNSFLDLSSSYSNEAGKNNFEFIFNNGFSSVRRERENSEYKTHSYNINLNYGLNKSSSLKLFSLYNFWDRNLAGVELGYSSVPSKQIDRDFFSSVSFNKTFNPSMELSSSLYYKYSLMNYYGPQNLSPSLIINSFYKLNSYNNSAELKYSNRDKYDLTLGYEMNYSSISSNETEKGKLIQPSVFIAGKVELENLPLSKISLYPSLRYDYYSNINEHVYSGKMGVNIKPFDKVNLSFKSSFGNNFRAPTFNDLYWIGLGNKNLLPERSLSFDGGAYFSFNLLGDNQLEVSYFNVGTTERILWKPDQTGVWRPVNIGKVKSEGVDFSFKSYINLLKHFSVGINFNYNYASSLKKNQNFIGDNTYDKQLLYVPQEYVKSLLMLNYIISYDLVKQISLNLFYTFTGKRYVNLENTRFLPYYELIDANINVILSLFKVESSLKFAVNNITNSDYQVISGYPMPLRNYKIQIGFKY